ncbi:putative transposase [Trichonephila clavipes]|uniref:Putative transposase n=1 Tax=Trichonephila clavipes TaxID=2585209 RepID=A0A8X6VJC2_TRICX|nr:putative transposase [Trichonephila clavipes]
MRMLQWLIIPCFPTVRLSGVGAHPNVGLMHDDAPAHFSIAEYYSRGYHGTALANITSTPDGPSSIYAAATSNNSCDNYLLFHFSYPTVGCIARIDSDSTGCATPCSMLAFVLIANLSSFRALGAGDLLTLLALQIEIYNQKIGSSPAYLCPWAPDSRIQLALFVVPKLSTITPLNLSVEFGNTLCISEKSIYSRLNNAFRFVEWAQNEIAVVPDFHKRILFSDEVHFWLNGYVNKQNCRIWSKANPQVYFETPLHPEKLTVWSALWAGGIIGPYFKNDEGHNVTVNGDRYRAMITNFFIPELNNHDVQELWFQQDGATCHTARATIDLLKDTFGDRLILRFGPVNWPPRSCDLTPLDYFLWGYVKSLVYTDKPQTLDHLEDNNRRVIADIRPQMLEKVIENWTSRLDYIRASRGSYMPEIIFKM